MTCCHDCLGAPGFTCTTHRRHSIQLVMALTGTVRIRSGPDRRWSTCGAALVRARCSSRNRSRRRRSFVRIRRSRERRERAESSPNVEETRTFTVGVLFSAGGWHADPRRSAGRRLGSGFARCRRHRNRNPGGTRRTCRCYASPTRAP